MFKIQLIGDKTIELYAKKGELLSDVFKRNGIQFDHPCSGNGICGKCAVEINGKRHLACKYIVDSDIEINLSVNNLLQHFVSKCDCFDDNNLCFCLDIGTTTLALALVDETCGEVIDYISASNPQGVYGADVISRIKYCAENGPSMLQSVLVSKVNDLCSKIIKNRNISKINTIYIAGNTTMLHLFLGVDCSSLGISPYKPVFLEKQTASGEDIGLIFAENVVLLPGISAYVGADIVAGLNCAHIPNSKKFNLLVDLGTNAEIALFNQERIICTSAAAGPCFEGVNISCGMTAANGAVYNVDDKLNYSVIGGGEAKGICATGLIDLISVLRKRNIIDPSGILQENEFALADNISLSAEDVRQFQLAKSAVFSGIIVLLNKCGLSFDDIDKFYISGGFSECLNIKNAVAAGLFPIELTEKAIPLGNSCLKGLVKYSAGNREIEKMISSAEYFDLADDSTFAEEFIKNLVFD